ncbi:hypothetical protein ACMZ62_01755 [Streptococcus pluranimalium]
MKYTYHEYRSRIVDQLLFPFTSQDWLKDYDDFLTQGQLKHLQASFEKISEFEQVLKPYYSDIKQFLVSVNPVWNIPLSLYLHYLDLGKDPASVEEFLNMMSQASDKDIKSSILRHLDHNWEGDVLSVDEFMELLEEDVESESQRWRFLWAYRHPRAFFDGIVDLYQKVLPLYTPFYELSKERNKAFGKTLDLVTLYQESQYNIPELIEQSGRENCEIFIISDWYAFNAINYDDTLNTGMVYCFIYPEISHFLHEKDDVTTEKLAISLKTLGDETRYQVLLASIKENIKSKDIAKELGITSANVTFHTQKLINADILRLSTKKNSSKYHINKELIRTIIERLKTDLNL